MSTLSYWSQYNQSDTDTDDESNDVLTQKPIDNDVRSNPVMSNLVVYLQPVKFSSFEKKESKKAHPIRSKADLVSCTLFGPQDLPIYNGK